LAAPLVHGLMLVEARTTPVDRALVVSGGSGYLAAVLRPLVASLDEIDAADAAGRRKGDYTLMLIDGAIETLPAALAARLGEGGRIVTGQGGWRGRASAAQRNRHPGAGGIRRAQALEFLSHGGGASL
jgi:protein-L-isoaspartate O-methyltransferase